MKNSFLYKRIRDFSKIGTIIEVICICAGVFVLPLVLPKLLALTGDNFLSQNSQFAVGTLVNCLLILGAVNFKGWTPMLGIVLVPSVSALLGGFVFSIGTTYTMMMIPAIWLANLVFVFLFKYLYVQRKWVFAAVAPLAIALKTGIIFAGFWLVTAFGAFPNPVFHALFSVMGLNQLITAALGSVLAFGLVKTLYRNKKKEA